MTLTLTCGQCGTTDQWTAGSFAEVSDAAETDGWDVLSATCPEHNDGLTFVIVPPTEPGCLCEATDYEAVGPCPLPGHDSRTRPIDGGVS